MKKITINNEIYVLESDVNLTPSKKQIVVLNRGWVVVGDYSEENDNCTLSNASVIRKWGTTKGLGELAENGPLTETVLDKCPNVHFNKLTIVARIDCNESKWN
jgi:hypothetical protein